MCVVSWSHLFVGYCLCCVAVTFVRLRLFVLFCHVQVIIVFVLFRCMHCHDCIWIDFVSCADTSVCNGLCCVTVTFVCLSLFVLCCGHNCLFEFVCVVRTVSRSHSLCLCVRSHLCCVCWAVSRSQLFVIVCVVLR